MRNEIQNAKVVVKIAEFQFRTLTLQHKVIVGHSNPMHVATKPQAGLCLQIVWSVQNEYK